MTKFRVFLLALLLPAVLHAQSAPTFERLTVPADRLPAGCTLTPSDSVREGGRMIGGQWAGVPVPTNPWRGSDRPIVGKLMDRFMGAVAEPDAPPMTAAERSRFRLGLADDVGEAYAAIYSGTIVYAVQFTRPAPDRVMQLRNETARRGGTVVWSDAQGAITISGARGPCFSAVDEYLREISKVF
jgi:hypothetical protein